MDAVRGRRGVPARRGRHNPPPPGLLHWAPPLEEIGGAEDGAVLLSDRWQATATRAGLWVGSRDGAPPPNSVHPVSGDGPVIETAVPASASTPLWPVLSRLLETLTPALRERAALHVHATPLDGGRALRTLAADQGVRVIRFAKPQAPRPAPQAATPAPPEPTPARPARAPRPATTGGPLPAARPATNQGTPVATAAAGSGSAPATRTPTPPPPAAPEQTQVRPPPRARPLPPPDLTPPPPPTTSAEPQQSEPGVRPPAAPVTAVPDPSRHADRAPNTHHGRRHPGHPTEPRAHRTPGTEAERTRRPGPHDNRAPHPGDGTQPTRAPTPPPTANGPEPTAPPRRPTPTPTLLREPSPPSPPPPPAASRPLPAAPVSPRHQSTEEVRRSFRVLADVAWERHSAAVNRASPGCRRCAGPPRKLPVPI